MTFTSALIDSDPIGSLNTAGVTMESAGNVAEATPSALTNGDEFTVTADNSSTTGTGTGTPGTLGTTGGTGIGTTTAPPARPSQGGGCAFWGGRGGCRPTAWAGAMIVFLLGPRFPSADVTVFRWGQPATRTSHNDPKIRPPDCTW